LPYSTLFPYTTLFRSHLNFIKVPQLYVSKDSVLISAPHDVAYRLIAFVLPCKSKDVVIQALAHLAEIAGRKLVTKVLHQRECFRDRKSTRLNSSHLVI